MTYLIPQTPFSIRPHQVYGFHEWLIQYPLHMHIAHSTNTRCIDQLISDLKGCYLGRVFAVSS
jgi:hypothetical protein